MDYEVDTIVKADKGGIYMPVRSYREDSREVVLIGVTHHALIEYWEWLQRFLDQLENQGFGILHEVTLDDWIPSEEFIELNGLAKGAYYKAVEACRAKFGIGHQTLELAIRDTWILADKPMSEIAAALMPSVNPKMLELNARPNLKKYERWADDPREMAINMIVGCTDIIQNDVRSEFKENRTNLYEELLLSREKVAMERILSEACKRSVATYWGAAHVPAFSKSLEELGYAFTSEEWIRVLPLHLPE